MKMTERDRKFWDEIDNDDDRKKKTSAENFQLQNRGAIEKILSQRQLKHVKLIQSGGVVKQLKRSDVHYQLLFGQMKLGGIVLLEGFSAKLQEEEEDRSRNKNVIVVSMSKQG